MRKRLTFIVPIFVLFTLLAIAGTITIANSGTTQVSTIVQTQDITAQKLALLETIAKKDLKKADDLFSLMTANITQNNNLDEAVYEIGKEYQYNLWNTEKANQAHNFNVEHFPDTKYGMLSNVEIIRSLIRNGKKTADSEVQKWQNKYSNQPEQAMGAYIIARAYAGNNKEEKAVELFQYAAAIAPKNIYGMLSQIRYDAAKKNYSAADVVADYLIASSPDSEDVKQGISDLANYYRDKKVFANAIHFYQAEIDTWNEYDDQVEPYTKMIYSYIDMNDTAKAKFLIDKIQDELKENPKLARANFDIANYYLKTGDSENALQLHEYNVQNYRDSLESLWSQAAQVWYYVRNSDEDKANTKYAEMLFIYANEKTLPKEVFQIGDIYIEVDNTEKARSLYQQVLDEWPESEYVFNAKAGFIKADIHNGYDEAAMTGVDNLMAEYMENTGLPHAVFSFGEQYWDLAQSEKRKLPKGRLAVRTKGDSEKMVYYYSEALSLWERIINQLPESQNLSTAYRMAAEASRAMGEHETALQYFKAFVEKWPEDNYAGHCQFMVCSTYQSMAGKGIITEEEAYKSMKIEYEKMVQNYPDNPQCSTVHAYINDYEINHNPVKVPLTVEEVIKMIESDENSQVKGGTK